MIRVMIVEDERNIRAGIEVLIPWAELGCEVVSSQSNGKAALSYLEDHPVDIVLTDIKMHMMDGLELSRHIREMYPKIKVIILTAYSDFEFAKTAISYGVAGFVVKNEFIEELPKTLKRVIETIRSEKEQADELSFEGVLQRLDASTALSEDEIRRFGLEDYRYCICACEVVTYREELAKKDLFMRLNNILKIALKDCEFCMLALEEDYYLIGIRYARNGQNSINNIVDDFNSVLIMLEEFMRLDVHLGLSPEILDPRELLSGYAQAKEALARISIKGCALSVYDNRGKANDSILDIDSFVAKIVDLTFDEESDGAVAELERFAEELGRANYSFEQSKLYMLVIYSALIHRAVRYQLDVDKDFSEMERRVYVSIQSAKSLRSLAKIGDELILELRQICVGKQNYKNELVRKIDDYIKTNYKEELTLQVISSALFLNASYVSRAYKKLTGFTITEKIAAFRVAKARELLRNPNYKIYEVAQAVGFKDAAYFTTVFLKYENMSPTEYRQKF